MTRLSINYLAQNAEGKLFLQMRNGPKSNPRPMRWGVFGGMCEDGEIYSQTLLREFEEELGLTRTLNDFEDLGTHEIPGWKLNLYLLKCPLEWGDFKLTEGAGAGFFTHEEIDMIDIWDNHEKIIAAYRKAKGILA